MITGRLIIVRIDNLPGLSVDLFTTEDTTVKNVLQETKERLAKLSLDVSSNDCSLSHSGDTLPEDSKIWSRGNSAVFCFKRSFSESLPKTGLVSEKRENEKKTISLAEAVFGKASVNAAEEDMDSKDSKDIEGKDLNSLNSEDIVIKGFTLRVKNGLLQSLSIPLKLREIFRAHRAVNSSSVFQGQEEQDAERFFHIFENLRDSDVIEKTSDAQSKKMIEKFFRMVQPFFNERTKMTAKMLAEKRIAYKDLWFLFPARSLVKFSDRELETGGKVSSFNYSVGFFSCFSLRIQQIQTDGIGFFRQTKTVSVGPFEGLRDLSDFPFQLLTTTEKTAFSARGRLFQEYAIGHHHRFYEGAMFVDTGFGLSRSVVNGRVMVDAKTFTERFPNYPEFHDFSRNSKSTIKTLTDKQLWMTWPTIPAFCFTKKAWGEIHIGKLQKIEFRTKAFEQLVLDSGTKKLIRSVVRSQMSSNPDRVFSDIIEGKGNGAIFLLHGPPGVGKTSSAETLAEEMQRPLYAVTTGELGTKPEKMEGKLKSILATAARWDALMLLDEADVFLERRSVNDIERNALVSVFLRLLEYHQGVLFLTTNRVKEFDEAFLSRISVALSYKEFDETTRGKVWTTLLKAAELPDHLLEKPGTIQALSKFDINGRQIRTIIRMASCIAQQDNRPIVIQDIITTIHMTTDFVEEVKSISQN